MRVTEHPVFQRFWYPLVPLAQLATGPQRFELLGRGVVLFCDRDGRPVALADRCCHRSARLSLGEVQDGCIVCPYHGWTYDGGGQCVRIPQQPERWLSRIRVPAYRCEARYGYAWVCLGEPLAPIPEIPEAADPAFRLIHEFYEVWNCAGLRVMENELDMAHPSFVHRGTFGSDEHLVASDLRVEEFEHGFHFHATLGVKAAHPGSAEQRTTRILDTTWYMPFTCRIRIGYPSSPAHVVVNTQVPIDARRSMCVQFCLHEDRGDGVNENAVRDFDRRVTLEDRAVLETTDPDVPLEVAAERHMPSDQPSLLMRRRLAALIAEHETKPTEACA